MKQWHCRHCGSTNVYCDAFASMNDDQDVQQFDATYCQSPVCEGEERKLEFRERLPDDNEE